MENSNVVNLGRLARRIAAMIVLAVLASGAAADDVRDYALQCDAEIEATVPAFDCTTGVELGMDGTEGGKCSKPPYLPGAGCYAGSRIGQFPTADNIGIVFLCRKKRTGNLAHEFDDIAVIQTNFDTGKTCFYQKLQAGMDGRNVPAPTDGGFWMEPTVMAKPENACAQCHDSGPFLRTPYVMQAAATITAFAAKNRNRDSYSFPGNQFLDWNGKIYKLQVDNGDDANSCSNACHLMGANSIDPKYGTNRWGLYSAGAVESPHYRDPLNGSKTAHWMRPAQKSKDGPDPRDIAGAQLVARCAQGETLPGCVLTPWGGQLEALIREHAHREYGRTPNYYGEQATLMEEARVRGDSLDPQNPRKPAPRNGGD